MNQFSQDCCSKSFLVPRSTLSVVIMKTSTIAMVGWSIVALTALPIPDDELYRDLVRQADKVNKMPSTIGPALAEKSEELAPPTVRGKNLIYSLKIRTYALHYY